MIVDEQISKGRESAVMNQDEDDRNLFLPNTMINLSKQISDTVEELYNV